MALQGNKIRKQGISTREATLQLRNMLKDKGVDPLEYLAEHLATKDAAISEKDRCKIAIELAKYTAPQLKSVDLGNADEDGLVIRIKRYSSKEAESMFSDEGKAEIKANPDGEGA